MNYELALRLKNAGFPQEPTFIVNGAEELERICDYYFIIRPYSTPTDIVFLNKKQYSLYPTWGTPVIKAPTLSELIEACGEHFYDLIKSPDTTQHWTVMGWKDVVNDGTEKHVVHGATPEEAVANLWLVLKEKDGHQLNQNLPSR